MRTSPKNSQFLIRCGMERIGDENAVPVVAGDGVLDQRLDFVGPQVAPIARGFGHLLVAQVVFIFARRQVFFGNELPTEPLRRQNSYFSHGLTFLDECVLTGRTFPDPTRLHYGTAWKILKEPAGFCS